MVLRFFIYVKGMVVVGVPCLKEGGPFVPPDNILTRTI